MKEKIIYILTICCIIFTAKLMRENAYDCGVSDASSIWGLGTYYK